MSGTKARSKEGAGGRSEWVAGRTALSFHGIVTCGASVSSHERTVSPQGNGLQRFEAWPRFPPPPHVRDTGRQEIELAQNMRGAGEGELEKRDRGRD